MECVLSIDGGTEGIRVAVVDRDGSIVQSAVAGYETSFPAPGWAEQTPESWWDALGSAVRACVSRPTFDVRCIKGIGLDATTCTLVALNRNMEAIRPALLWMDVRAGEEAEHIFATDHRAMEYCPAGCNAEWMLSKALWLARSEAATYRSTRYFLEYVDWLVWKLTGVVALNLNTASQRWFYHNREWGFPEDLYRELGVGDLVDRIPETVVPCGAYVGTVTPDAAAHLALPPGIPVFEGGGDAFVAALGLGVAAPGPVAMIAGSSNVFVSLSRREVHGRGLYGGFPDAMVDGLWLVEAGQASAGSILAWFKRNLLRDLPDDEAYSTMDEEAARVPPGSGGVIVLDNFQGNRSPFSDSTARGAFCGLSLASDRATLFRAVMEGIACGAAHIRHCLETNGIEAHEFVACGGATKSDIYMQILCDVVGTPIRLSSVAETALLGGAMLAATGLGWYADLLAATSQMVRYGRTFQPDAAAHRAYRPVVERHERIYHRLKGIDF